MRSHESDEPLHPSREGFVCGSSRLQLWPACADLTLPLLDRTLPKLLLSESTTLPLPGSERHSCKFLSHSCSSSHQDCSSALPAVQSNINSVSPLHEQLALVQHSNEGQLC